MTTDLKQEDGGFFKAYGTPESKPQLALNGLGDPWALLDPGFALKKFPSCYAGHRAIDGLMTLRAELGLTAENVEKVICRVAPGALTPMKYPDPQTGLEAKFSIPYALAVGVLDGKYSLWSFTDEAVRRPQVRVLLEKMMQIEDERCLGGDPAQLTKSWGSRGFVEVEAQTNDGRSATSRVDLAPGHPKRELGWDEISEKFKDCATTAGLAPTVASHLLLRLGDLHSARDMQSLLMAMRPE